MTLVLTPAPVCLGGLKLVQEHPSRPTSKSMTRQQQLHEHHDGGLVCPHTAGLRHDCHHRHHRHHRSTRRQPPTPWHITMTATCLQHARRRPGAHPWTTGCRLGNAHATCNHRYITHSQFPAWCIPVTTTRVPHVKRRVCTPSHNPYRLGVHPCAPKEIQGGPTLHALTPPSSITPLALSLIGLRRVHSPQSG